ncbi:ankyrin repeat domain-containing protein [Legionella fairfieldensis]|uniref:ankyrin repeat domain-containing protein n=1 Tax=Legionella fairfieldensis TaxID=45064 RepID=UPI00048F9B6D|nr:ankyrin repeat domain-containing protein [Legionella fairfieldensis]
MHILENALKETIIKNDSAVEDLIGLIGRSSSITLSATDDENKSFLYWALYCDNLKAFKLLFTQLKNDEVIFSQTTTNETLFSLASAKNNIDLLDELFTLQPNEIAEKKLWLLVNNEGKTPLDIAIQNNHKAATRYLLQKIKEEPDYLNIINQVNKEGMRALDMALESGHVELVELLLQYGADPFLEDSQNCVSLARFKKLPDGKGNELLIDLVKTGAFIGKNISKIIADELIALSALADLALIGVTVENKPIAHYENVGQLSAVLTNLSDVTRHFNTFGEHLKNKLIDYFKSKPIHNMSGAEKVSLYNFLAACGNLRDALIFYIETNVSTKAFFNKLSDEKLPEDILRLIPHYSTALLKESKITPDEYALVTQKELVNTPLYLQLQQDRACINKLREDIQQFANQLQQTFQRSVSLIALSSAPILLGLAGMGILLTWSLLKMLKNQDLKNEINKKCSYSFTQCGIALKNYDDQFSHSAEFLAPFAIVGIIIMLTGLGLFGHFLYSTNNGLKRRLNKTERAALTHLLEQLNSMYTELEGINFDQGFIIENLQRLTNSVALLRKNKPIDIIINTLSNTSNTLNTLQAEINKTNKPIREYNANRLFAASSQSQSQRFFAQKDNDYLANDSMPLRELANREIVISVNDEDDSEEEVLLRSYR